MVDESELPSSPPERATMMENLMTERATGGMGANTRVYEYLRREFMADPVTKDLLPTFVRTSRTVDAFWPWIKNEAGSYADRRRLISEPLRLSRRPFCLSHAAMSVSFCMAK